MKILKLRLSNLNSLVGEWEIDFTNPAYADDGIFAITGPTGAGKSTLLDAMCLSLYGATPRLGKITKSDNELMSRHTGECFAELTFATVQGVYRSYWYQHRGRRKAANPLQTQRHELVDASSGKILEAKVSSVPEAVEQLTGLDFTRFTRSMLLAQGEFAAFLHATDNERSAILEQITGTAIYAELSRATYERSKEESEKLQQLRSELDQLELLDPQALEELQQRHQRLLNSAAATDKALDAARVSQQWVDRLQELKAERDALVATEQTLQQQVDTFKSQQLRLSRDAQARPLLADYRELTLQQGRLDEVTESRQKLATEKPQAEQAEIEAEQARVKQQAATAEIQQKYQAWQPKLRQARVLDAELQGLQQRGDAIKAELDDAHRQHKRESQRQSDLQTQITTLGKQMNESRNWLSEHAGLANLSGELAVIENQFLRLQRLQTQLQNTRQEEDAVVRSQHELAALPLADSHAQQLKQAEKNLTAAKSLLQAREDNAALAATVASLEAERERLQRGAPCPLCGATEHPYVDHSQAPQKVPPSALEKAREEYENALQHLQTLQVEQVISGSERDSQQQRLQDKLTALKQTRADLDEERSALQAKLTKTLAEYRVELPPVSDLDSCLTHLRGSADEWQRYAQLFQQQERELGQLQAREEGQHQVLRQGEAQVTKLSQQYESLCTEEGDKRSQREKLLPQADTDQFEKQLEQELRAANERHEEARERARSAAANMQRLQDEATRLEASHEREQATLKRLQAAFAETLQRNEFADLDAYRGALLEDDVRAELEAQSKALAQRQAELKVSQNNLTQALSKAHKHQPEDPAALLQALSRLRNESNELHREQGAVEQTLREQQARSQKAADKQQQVNQQRLEYTRWSKLNDLIGSADGKKYRNFAQGLTFEVMIEFANQQLARMTDRYLLQRDDDAPLQLNVIDDYQAGEIRSTKNLSGGESFIVSLALALGLSKMSSQKVRVDSLFLDEGFGTLDEDALDVALDTLSSLQQDGKVIGVISHVAALKERIATQIQVRSGTGGRSSLQGPGVQQLNKESR